MPEQHEGFQQVIDGHRHFSEEVYPEHRELFDELKDKQNPQVLFITCSDSRVDPALITQTHPGDLFVCRNIGNIVPASGEMLGGVSTPCSSTPFSRSRSATLSCAGTPTAAP